MKLNLNPAVRPASQTLRTLEEAFAKLDVRLRETGILGDTKHYSSLLRAASTSPYESTRAAAMDHLRRRGDFSPNMRMVDFIKKADQFGFEALTFFDALGEGRILILARSADAQIMLAHVVDNVVIEVELSRYLLKDGSNPEFNVKCFGEDRYRVVEDVTMMIFATTPYLLGAVVERDLHSRRLATNWKSCPAPMYHGLLMGFEMVSLGQDREETSRLRAEAISGDWRDIFALDYNEQIGTSAEGRP